MPSFKPDEPWRAEPHTLAKIEIVRRYVFLWVSIVGSKNRRLLYIDAFAGPGKYTNSDQSSPIAALMAAKEAIERPGSQLEGTELQFLFVEKNPSLANSLRGVISACEWPRQMTWTVESGTFAQKVGGVLEEIRRGQKRLAPTFAFIDPFGATEVPFSLVSEILSHPHCEVLINLDSDGIGRIRSAQEFEKNKDNLDVLFGDPGWHSHLDPTLPMSRLCSQVLTFYKKRLRSISRIHYVFAFAMNSRRGQLNYHLVFASQHPLGLEKMKEAMKAVDQTGNYSFSDDTIGQRVLPFDFAAPAVWADRMCMELSGQWRPYTVFRDYALNETPFTNPKAMLEHLKKNGKVKIQWTDKAATRGFPEEKIKLILLER